MNPSQESLDRLRAVVTPGAVIVDTDLTLGYRWDMAKDRDAGWPCAVLRAKNVEDVQAAMRWASAEGVQVVPRGAGTGLSGGATAVDGALTLCVEQMTRIEVKADLRTAVAQAGALNGDVKRAAAEVGLWYPPDPSSFEISTIGGNVATNAGGLCCLKYGVTSDYVLGLQVVLADGTLLTVGSHNVKDVAGLALTKLFVGSEGILGVITEVTVRLVPAPDPSCTLVAMFRSVESASDAVSVIMSSFRPATLELMDGVSIRAVDDYLRMGLDRSADAFLLASSDAAGSAARDEVDRMLEICRAYGATESYVTDDPAEAEQFWAARRAHYPAIERLGDFMLEDVCVPPGRLPALVRGIRRVAESRELVIAIVAHAGDGNTHPVIVFDASDNAQTERARLAFDDIMELALSLGGTITGEHGVGRNKRGWLPRAVGPDVMEVTRRIKRALDPELLLAPGVMIESQTQTPSVLAP